MTTPTPKQCMRCHRLTKINGYYYCSFMDLRLCPEAQKHIPIPIEARKYNKATIPPFNPNGLKKHKELWKQIHDDLFRDFFRKMTYKQMGDKYNIDPWQIGMYIRRYSKQIEWR